MQQMISRGFLTCLPTKVLLTFMTFYGMSGLFLAFVLAWVERIAISKVRTKEGTGECC